MRLVENKGHSIIKWSRLTEGDLTWRKVREWCKTQIIKMEASKEAELIKAYKQVVDELQHKIINFNERKARYQRMINSIKDTDSDIDIRFDELYKKENNQ